MKKSISVSNLTLTLWLEYVRPADWTTPGTCLKLSRNDQNRPERRKLSGVL